LPAEIFFSLTDTGEESGTSKFRDCTVGATTESESESHCD
jgi:hypothetical protein